MRRQFVLDKETNRILNDLAADGAGNHSQVVRHAIRAYAMMEDRLEKIVRDPRFQKMMADSERAIQEGRVKSQAEVEKLARAARRRKRG